jgi:hypothetical protein
MGRIYKLLLQQLNRSDPNQGIFSKKLGSTGFGL